MAKITRSTLKVFGLSGSSDNYAKFGSLQAGSPIKTKDIATIQALAAWDNGFQDAVYASNKALLLEDLNSFAYLHSTMMGYVLQEGIPEWDAGTTYFLYSVVKKPGTFEQYGSLIDDNLNNVLPNQVDSAQWQYLNPPIPESFPVGNGIKENLQVKPNSGSPLYKVDVVADRLSVQGVVLETVSKIADVTVSGANGLDTGSEASSTWYAVFVICNDAGSLVASLLSLSQTPALPTGYTKYRRVGWVRNNASSNFVQAIRMGDFVHYMDATQLTVSVAVSATGVSFADSMPATSQVGLLDFLVVTGSDTASLSARVTGTSMAYRTLHSSGFIGGPFPSVTSAQVLMNTSRQIDITVVNGTYSVVVAGYQDPV